MNKHERIKGWIAYIVLVAVVLAIHTYAESTEKPAVPSIPHARQV